VTDIEIPLEPAADREPVLASSAEPAGGSHSSILDALRAEVREVEEDAYKVMPVGKLSMLAARYRVLSRDERTRLQRETANRQRLRQRVTRTDDSDTYDEVGAARLLIESLDELLYRNEDGELIPLAEALRAEGVSGDFDELRYNAELVRVLDLAEELGLDLDGPKPPSSVDVVTALHRWGDDCMPLITNARVLNTWMSALSAEALEGVLEG